MRNSAVFTAVFAAAAIAKPMFKRQEVVVTDTDIVLVTDIITVTAGELPASSVVASAATSPAAKVNFHHHHHNTVTLSTTAAAPAPTTDDSTTEAPAPATTEAPAPTTESAASPTDTPTEAPASTEATSTDQAPAPATTEATSAAAAATATSYSEAVVNHHNYHRSNHSAPALVWNETLASIAQQIAASCNYAHNTQVGGGGYGQNIAAGTEASHVSDVITNGFYDGEVANFTVNGLYGQPQPSMKDFDGWGHFTQVVWKGTTSAACYTMDCTNQGLAGVGNSNIPPFFTVCNYYPPGNFDNEYADNVGDSLNQASIDGSHNVDYSSISDPTV